MVGEGRTSSEGDPVVDMSDIEGLSPYDLADAEALRIGKHLTALPDEAWLQPSRCEGWSVRDVAAHLSATEEYHHACLEGRVKAFVAAAHASGTASLADSNARGIAARSWLTNAQVVAQWRDADAVTRREMRARDGGQMDTSIGLYPVRLQAFHVASELAIHADDMGVPVSDNEAGARWQWRARFSRFALKEAKPEVGVRAATGGGTEVTVGGVPFVLGDRALAEAVAGRLPADAGLADEVRTALSVTP